MKTRSILNRSMLITSSFTVTVVAALVFGHSAQAATKTIGSGSTLWMAAGSWSPSGVPAASDDVLINAGTSTMTLTAADLAIQYITFTNGNPRVLENSSAATDSNLTLSGVDGSGNLINLVPAFGTPLTFTIRNGTTNALNLILGASGNFNAVNGTSVATLLIGSAISETGGSRSMTKTGTGTLTLTGANSYTGITGVTGGILNLGNGTTSGSLNSSSTLAVGGNGIFNFTGAAAATQTVNGLNANAGYGTVNNTVSGTTLTLGGITRSGSGMVGFPTTTGDINTSTTNDATGIIGTWATRGTTSTLGYAVSGGAGVSMTTFAGTAATAANINNATSTSTNYDYAGAGGNITQTGPVTANSLRITGGTITTWANAGNGIALNGLMLAGTTNVSESGAGTITIGTDTNTELDIITNDKTLTLGSSIVNNGAGASKVVIGSSNGGIVVLSGSNSYTGGTVVNSGILRVTNNNAVGDVLVNLGGTLNVDNVSVTLAGNITGSGRVTKSNSASSLTLNGNNTFSGGMTLTDGRLILGTGTNNGIGTGTLTLSSGSLQSPDNSSRSISNSLSMGSNALGFGAAQGALTGLGDLTFTSTASTVSVGGAKTWTVTNATTVTFANNWSGNAGFNVTKAGTGTLVFNGNITSSGVGVVVSAGTLALNGTANTFTSATTINGGNLRVNGNLGATAVSVNGNGTIDGTLSGTGSIGGSVTVNANGHFAVAIASTTGAQDPLAITGTLTLGSGNILDLTAASAPAAGVYTLATAVGGVTYTAGTVNLTGVAGVVSVSGNSLILTVSGGSVNFAGWASTNGVTGGVNGDSDNDGIPNGVEYGLNLNFAGSDGAPGTYSGNVVTFNKRTATSGNSDLSYRIEISPDLGVTPWTDVGAYTQNDGSVISATIPNGPAKNFARLRVVVTP